MKKNRSAWICGQEQGYPQPIVLDIIILILSVSNSEIRICKKLGN
jgi:hypothetical protein